MAGFIPLTNLNFVRTCAIVHDIGKPSTWAKRKPWSDHINQTNRIVRESLGDDFAISAMRHHTGRSYPNEVHPQTDVERIISLADNLSSGADRHEEPEHGTPLPKPPMLLTHVLSKGNVNRREIDSATLEYSDVEILDRMKKLKTVFDEDPQRGYVGLFDLLQNSRLQDIPADTRSPINDVSLWDHLKLTAAFATCIWLDGGYKGGLLKNYTFALISGDADRISGFVNVSPRLPDLNARSEKIRTATTEAGNCVAALLGPECLIFAGGGGLLAVSPISMAEKIVDAVKESFETMTKELVAITVSRVDSTGAEIQKEFGRVWKEAQRRLRQRKSERVPRTMEGLDQDVEICDICHVQPAARADTGKMLPYDASPRPERLCESCWQLRTEGHGVGLDQLRRSSNFLAIIKADGDSIGKVLGGDRLLEFGKATTPSRLSTISRHIHQVCEKQLEKVVKDGYGRCLFSGGDDILAIVPGEESLSTAQRIAAEFTHELAYACTISAGVAIFRYDLPFYAGLEGAQRLLHAAKESKSKDSVAFAIIGGVGLTPEEVEKAGHGPRRWSELAEILRLSRHMAEGSVASSQIRKVAEVAFRKPEVAEILIKNLMGKGERGRGLNWKDGELFLSHLESGILLDAFAVYNAFKV